MRYLIGSIMLLIGTCNGCDGDTSNKTFFYVIAGLAFIVWGHIAYKK